MGKLKVFIYLTLLILANKAIAQVDSVTFRYNYDVSIFRVICQAQKVDISGTDTTLTDFVIADTINGAYSFDWGGFVEPINDGLPGAIFQFPTAGTYTINVSIYDDANKKTITDSQDIIIRDEIIIPNVFTPGYDGINDLFIVKANGITPLEISIYSRTGTLVHQSKAPIIVWDGRNPSGSFVGKGVYYYILTSEDPSVETRKGFIHIYYDNEDIK